MQIAEVKKESDQFCGNFFEKVKEAETALQILTKDNFTRSADEYKKSINMNGALRV